MKKAVLSLVAAATLLGTAVEAQAWSQEVHRRIVIDAVNYMKANPGTTNYAKLLAGATAAGYTIDQFAAALGQGAYDVDDFADTYICGASTGNCQLAPVWGAGASIVKYTSYWHFQNQTRGADVHGNDFGGYNYDLLTVWGDIDNMAASWLYGDYLDDGKGNLKATSKNPPFQSTDATQRVARPSRAFYFSENAMLSEKYQALSIISRHDSVFFVGLQAMFALKRGHSRLF